ncbi:hypothetical protein [Pandoraea terrigena]|uniref:Uncharacterized protein n=1 Tax=Pandoraea terrigena TaxID=2508292 RepID=A0A5E4USN1_9BURK|nr:hypothetical protein [Pandoraea terrigena]VVE01440.1 hypothetical protein PTE31013_02164 [Pandoraea terrigena]
MSDLFVKNGDEYLMSAGGTLLVAADAMYGPAEESTPEGRCRAAALADAILSVATERGFKSRDLFETMLARREVSDRVLELARKVDRCLGKDGFQVVLKRIGGA